jgi:hypothetical protein
MQATVPQEQQVIVPPAPKQLNAVQQITCSSVSGSLGIFVGFPFDTVKTKLQTQRPGQYKGVFNCLTTVLRDEGPLRLYCKLISTFIDF